MKKIKIAIIGSGPSSVAASYYALENYKNIQIDMIDVSSLPPKDINIFEEGNIKSRNDFLFKIYQLKNLNFKKSDKYFFGSDYVYDDKNLNIKKDKFLNFNVSFAKGGLGNVWGANLSVFNDNDIKDKWPFKISKLNKYYDFVKKLIYVSAEIDDMDKYSVYKLFDKYDFQLSQQTSFIYSNYKRNQSNLLSQNIKMGRAKLSVNNSVKNLSCLGCGLCMYGCPHKKIFNPRYFIDEKLSKKFNFNFYPNIYVNKFKEENNKVLLNVKNLITKKKLELTYDKVFIGAGPISSALIAKLSNTSKNKKIILNDSSKILFPLFLTKRIKNSTNELNVSLAQLAINISDLKSTNKSVHIQIYPYNDIFISTLFNFLNPKIVRIIELIFKPLFDRFLIGMIYFHSDDSSKMSLSVDKINNNLSIYGKKSNKIKLIFREVRKLLNKNKKNLGFYIPPFIYRTNKIGNGQHFGSNLPMKKKPKDNQTDINGKLFGSTNCYFIDSSVLPSIPAQPPTYTLMANSARIIDIALGSQ